MADSTTTNDTDSPGDLRAQRDKLAAEKKELADELAALKQDKQLRDAGFGHLSDRQRRTILRDLAEDGLEFTAESVKEIATEHGYPLTATPPPTNDAGQGNGDGQQDQSQGQNGNGSQGDDVEDSLTAMDLMRRAQAIAAGNAPSSDFETEIRNAKSGPELTDLIRTKGARHGIVHEWDVP